MSSANPIGLRGLHSITWYVRELPRKRRLFVDTLGFREVSGTTQSQRAAFDDRGQQSLIFEAGKCRVVCTAPELENSRAARFLARHPEGIGRVTFEVEALAQTRRELEKRDATFISGDGASDESRLELATPIDDLEFCFVPPSRSTQTSDSSKPARSRSGPSHFDHVTINTGTILPVSLWLRHLLGLEKHWETEFHTSEGAQSEPQPGTPGSGLKSVVLWDPPTGIKFALNEPKRPNFFASQIELFRRDHRGSGIQHVAVHVHDIVGFVATLRGRGMQFAAVPLPYYDQLQARLDRIGVGAIDEPMGMLRKLGILVDGSGPGRYLLQIFVEDDAAFLGGEGRSPFFLELIERKGCSEFGAGNFRALFDSIAAAQAKRASVS